MYWDISSKWERKNIKYPSSVREGTLLFSMHELNTKDGAIAQFPMSSGQNLVS